MNFPITLAPHLQSELNQLITYKKKYKPKGSAAREINKWIRNIGKLITIL